MALLQTPKFNVSALHDFNIDLPGSGGINLKDLEFELNPNQSPKMLNMIYRNGHLCKRYGQEQYQQFIETDMNDNITQKYMIREINYFGGDVFVVNDKGIYRGDIDNDALLDLNLEEVPAYNSKFFCFNRRIYYYTGGFRYFDTVEVRAGGGTVHTWTQEEPYAPEICINRKPDGSYHDLIEEYNRMGAGFKNVFHGDGSSTLYQLTDKNLDSRTPIVKVDEVQVTDFTFDATKGTVTFTTAPVKGTNNVEITAYKTVEEEGFDPKYFIAYGGNNNSRMFYGGCGDGKIYYSNPLDATYVPINNYFQVGNDEEDVVGFGEQYDTLMVFKPREIYALDYYIDNENKGAFQMKLVNGEIGCDAPKSIQLINNQLVWLSSTYGVCTLVSTAIEDERNVRILSRNIEGGYHYNGLMQEKNLTKAVSVDFDNKYMLAVNGKVYIWDYLMTPYANTGKLDQDAKRLAWFIFDNINVDFFIKTKENLYFAYENVINKMTNNLNDFGEPINAYYQTPYLQFGAVPYLKTVKNIYVQTLADNAVQIDMTYFTEESPNGEKEPEPIRVYDKLWHSFKWNTFGWQFTNIANTFRRKCSLKKIQMCSVLFENNETDKDMAISHIGFQYMIVKNIK